MKRIGVLANPQVNGIGPTIDRFLTMAEKKGISVCLADDLKDVCRKDAGSFCHPAQLAGRSDIVIAMGGDGTILRAARFVGSAGTPILGVNLGRLGFLAGAAPEELEESLDHLLRGDYVVEDRMTLEARVGDRTSFALNEIVIEKGGLTHMVQVKTWMSDAPISSFFGNGLIVATPTGSTGYSLSAGGAVLHTSMEALIVTPICPHSLSLRPVVVPGNQTITVRVIAEHTDMMVTADGQTVAPLPPGETVVVRQAPYKVRLINLQGLSFYDLLRRKLDWSLDRRESRE